MDELSTLVCIPFITRVIRREWSHHLKKVLSGADLPRLVPVWTRAGFRTEQEETLSDIDFWLKLPQLPVQVWVDWFWNMTFEELVQYPGYIQLPEAFVNRVLQTLNDDQERTRARAIPFDQLLQQSKNGLLSAFKGELFRVKLPIPGRLPPEIFSSFTDGRDPTCMPSLNVFASIRAAIVKSDHEVEDNDLFDFMHAISAIPYCDALLTDKFMKSFFIGRPLEFGRVYGIQILSRPEEILTYLDSLSDADANQTRN